MAWRARLRPRGLPCPHARHGAQPASAADTPPRPRRAQSRPRRACALKRCVLSGVSRGWRARAGAGSRRVLPGVYSSGFDGKVTFSSVMQLICSTTLKKPLKSSFCAYWRCLKVSLSNSFSCRCPPGSSGRRAGRCSSCWCGSCNRCWPWALASKGGRVLLVHCLRCMCAWMR